MSYQVLARKWRPQVFSELVGQQHVVDAITNALENNKLHHAYLFTGTRGVGKTTIARIFSKSLNCEEGQSANPCGKCDTCKDISDGRYVDLLEIDAASRTKVEDTRELLDNVQYRPTRGKYKVYLIDEVHMLSKHSFNALLKTLEEPPEHVKFLLATTDPQKLPVTVLSRCLQFSLRALTKEQIQGHLTHILGQEQVPFEASALAQLAKAAQGSIRDSLSLTDQAIAQGNNQVSLAVVSSMLGLLNKNHIIKLLKFICERDKVDALKQLDEIVAQSPDYSQILSQLLALLHQVALTQIVPDVCKLEGDSAKGIYTLAKSVSSEHIQLLYQIGVNGKKDLPHAPDARSGLQMTVLRMLAFSPAQKIDLDIDSLIAQEPNLPAFETLTEPAISPPQSPQPQSLEPQSLEPQSLEITPSASLQNNASDMVSSVEQESNVEQETLSTDGTGLKETESNATEPELVLQDNKLHTEAQNSEKETVVSDDVQHTDDKHILSTDESTSKDAEPEASIGIDNASLVEAEQSGQPVSDQMSENQATRSQPPIFEGEQPPLPDEEPPMFDDMFAEQFEAPNAHSQEGSSFKQTDNSQESASSQHAPTQDAQQSDDNIAQTMALLKVKKELADFTNEKQEEAAAKKPISDEQTAPAVEQVRVYEMGHDFVPQDLQYTAYLDDNTKLTRAAQIDDYSAFVDSTPAQGMPRQLLIHANCEGLSNPLTLSLSGEHKHICEDDTVKRLESCLSEYFSQNITLEIKYGETQNTPFHIQSRIIDMRHEFATSVVNNDTSIQELVKVFDAAVVEDSIEAR